MITCTPISKLFPYTTLFRSSTTSGILIKRLAFQKDVKEGKRSLTILSGSIILAFLDDVCNFPFRLRTDRKSTRLNSSHVAISYAVFCLKKKQTKKQNKHYNS